MSEPWTAGRHTALFYDGIEVLYRGIAEFYAAGANTDPLLMVARPRTFKAVAGLLASDGGGAAANASNRIRFLDAEGMLAQLVTGDSLDQTAAVSVLRPLLKEPLASQPGGAIRTYGEMVDVLCERGQHDLAVALESIWNVLLREQPRLSLLCGYSIEHFKSDAKAAKLRAVCHQHTHVLHDVSEAKSKSADPELTRFCGPSRTLLDRTTRVRSTSAYTAEPSTGAVYVIDDDASMRRSLGRLLSFSNRNVRMFESAEAFLDELDDLAEGCLVLDIQLVGMGGLELMARLNDARLPWPVIVMTGEHDDKSELEAMRLGASLFLRKPFEPRDLLGAIERALV